MATESKFLPSSCAECPFFEACGKEGSVYTTKGRKRGEPKTDTTLRGSSICEDRAGSLYDDVPTINDRRILR